MASFSPIYLLPDKIIMNNSHKTSLRSQQKIAFTRFIIRPRNLHTYKNSANNLKKNLLLSKKVSYLSSLPCPWHANSIQCSKRVSDVAHGPRDFSSHFVFPPPKFDLADFSISFLRPFLSIYITPYLLLDLIKNKVFQFKVLYLET